MLRYILIRNLVSSNNSSVFDRFIPLSSIQYCDFNESECKFTVRFLNGEEHTYDCTDKGNPGVKNISELLGMSGQVLTIK